MLGLVCHTIAPVVMQNSKKENMRVNYSCMHLKSSCKKTEQRQVLEKYLRSNLARQ